MKGINPIQQRFKNQMLANQRKAIKVALHSLKSEKKRVDKSITYFDREMVRITVKLGKKVSRRKKTNA